MDPFLSFLGMPISIGEKKGIIALVSQYESAYEEMMDQTGIFSNHMEMVLANSEHLRKIEELAVTDPLTGLMNRRRFNGILADQLLVAERFGEPFSVIMLDIDHFKKVNDTYGHPFGDRVLQKVTEAMKQAIREVDVPCRYGGEEFIILLRKADKATASVTAERVRSIVARNIIKDGNISLNITVSVGHAQYPSDSADAKELVHFADQALYRAKNGGRDRVVAWSDADG